MPHIEIKCYPGRSEEQKKNCAEKLTEVIAETLGCGPESVSVAIAEVEKDAWKAEVWDKQIAPDMDKLYKKPGYTCE